ncbi:hypothetical protein [Acinetobacter bereziniae]|uniref:hypothetical protein n=1 Tax=Acinetobacter bereziniae TaxID=106648 RepID=UPI00300843AF
MIFKNSNFALLIVFLMMNSAHAIPKDSEIYVRNTHASYVNNGMCSLAFDVKAYDALDNIESIDFTVTMKNKNGKVLGTDKTSVSDLNFVGGRTYGNFYVEGKSACDAFGETLVITRAIVNHNDGSKPVDIVKTKQLKTEEFKPMKIIIGGK